MPSSDVLAEQPPASSPSQDISPTTQQVGPDELGDQSSPSLTSSSEAAPAVLPELNPLGSSGPPPAVDSPSAELPANNPLEARDRRLTASALTRESAELPEINTLTSTNRTLAQSVNPKTLNFYTRGLPKGTVLMLRFQPPKSSIPLNEQFSTAWKVIHFAGVGFSKAAIRYSDRFAFSCPQMSDDNVTEAATWVEVKRGEIASIDRMPGTRQITAHPGNNNESKLFVCKNDTEEHIDISFGLVWGNAESQRYEPMLSFEQVGSKSTLKLQFIPIVSAYITSDYQASQAFRAEIETEEIWSQDLNMLDDVTGWNLTVDEANGQFSITSAEKP